MRGWRLAVLAILVAIGASACEPGPPGTCVVTPSGTVCPASG